MTDGQRSPRFSRSVAAHVPRAVRNDEDAAALSAPSHLSLVQARLGHGSPLLSVEDALAHRWTDAERAAETKFVHTGADVVGGPETVRAGIEAAVAASQADEVIAIGNTPDPAQRRAAYARLAVALGIAPSDPGRESEGSASSLHSAGSRWA